MKKRAIALYGGGPVVGIEIGALKAFEKKQIGFDIFSCACVGSWIGCLYNSLAPNTDRLRQIGDFFRDEIFISDDVYESFPINYKVFRMNYEHSSRKLMEKIFNISTYRHLLLPQKLWEYTWKFLNNLPKTTDEYFYYISEGLALNPFVRFCTELKYEVSKNGVPCLISSKNFIDRFVDFGQLFRSDKLVYLNTYDPSRKQMEISVNRENVREYKKISADTLMMGSGVPHDEKYDEVILPDTADLDLLLENHPDIDEIWVIRIADSKEIRPPKNFIESSMLSARLPVSARYNDDIALFSERLREYNRKENKSVRLVGVLIPYEGLSQHWNHFNLNQGMTIGYNGTLKAIGEFENNNGEPGDFTYVQCVV